jgi:glycosyltransferase involved in cell wall biosynthesis
MKILMIAPEPFFEPRGTPFSEFYRIRALSEIGHKIDIITYPIGENVEIENLKIIRSFKIPFIKKIKIGPSFVKIILDLFLFPKAFYYAVFKKYDIIHTHEEAGYLGAFLNKFFNKPHIYDMHSSLPQQMTNFNFTKSKTIIKVLTILENFVLKNSNSVITICPELFNHVKGKFKDSNVILIENFLDEEYEPSREKIDKIKNIFPDKKIALYAGTLEHYQGIDLLIKVSQLLKEDVKILVVGGDENQIIKIKNIYKPDESKIRFLKQVPKKEIINYIKAADLLLSPRKEGTNTPLKIYSYLKSGKPIVATNILSHTQILTDEISILIPPTPEGIAAGIKRGLSEEGIKLGMNGKKFAEKNFSYEKYLSKVKQSISVFQKKK